MRQCGMRLNRAERRKHLQREDRPKTEQTQHKPVSAPQQSDSLPDTLSVWTPPPLDDKSQLTPTETTVPIDTSVPSSHGDSKTLLIRLWLWVGKKWRWDAIISVGAWGMIKLEQFGVAIVLLVIAGAALLSKLSQWEGIADLARLSRFLRNTGYLAVMAAFLLVCVYVNNERGSAPWFTLSRHNSVRSAAMAGVQAASTLNQFIGGKDESHLQELFGFNEMLDLNVHITRDRVISERSGGVVPFDVGKYLAANRVGDGTPVIFQAKNDRPDLYPIGSPVKMRTITPGKIDYVVAAAQYSNSKNRLAPYLTSGVLPQSIIYPLRDFDSLVGDEIVMLTHLLDEDFKQHPEYFLSYDDTNSELWHVIGKQFHQRFTLLQPKANSVIDAIRQFLQV